MGNQNKAPIYALVDDMVVSLFNKTDLTLLQEFTIPNESLVVTSAPVPNALIPVDGSFVFNFTHSMAEKTVMDFLRIQPYFDYNHTWNQVGTQLTITPQLPLPNSRDFIITLGRLSHAITGKPLGRDYELKVRTEDP
jgi:hypothetical protein